MCWDVNGMQNMEWQEGRGVGEEGRESHNLLWHSCDIEFLNVLSYYLNRAM
jgi:hypothetical protein